MKTYAYICNQGSRENNEDAVAIISYGEDVCIIAADGLGGHGKGEIASATVIEVAKQCFGKQGWYDLFFSRYFTECENKLEKKQKQERSYDGIKTTVVIACVSNDILHGAHVGDSRLYLFRKNRLQYRTLDHSVPQMLVYAGEIREKQIRNHPDRSRLLKVMGQRAEKVYFEEDRTWNLKAGDAVLLCTDGFWELIQERHMCKMLRKAKTAEEWLRLMQEVILKNGTGKDMDNYSAAAIMF